MLGLGGLKETLEHRWTEEFITDLARDGKKEIPTIGTVYWDGGETAEIRLTRSTVAELVREQRSHESE